MDKDVILVRLECPLRRASHWFALLSVPNAQAQFMSQTGCDDTLACMAALNVGSSG